MRRTCLRLWFLFQRFRNAAFLPQMDRGVLRAVDYFIIRPFSIGDFDIVPNTPISASKQSSSILFDFMAEPGLGLVSGGLQLGSFTTLPHTRCSLWFLVPPVLVYFWVWVCFFGLKFSNKFFVFDRVPTETNPRQLLGMNLLWSHALISSCCRLLFLPPSQGGGASPQVNPVV